MSTSYSVKGVDALGKDGSGRASGGHRRIESAAQSEVLHA